MICHRRAEFANDVTAFIAWPATVVMAMWDSSVQSYGNDRIARALAKIHTRAAPVKDALAKAQAKAQAELERGLAD